MQIYHSQGMVARQVPIVMRCNSRVMSYSTL